MLTFADIDRIVVEDYSTTSAVDMAKQLKARELWEGWPNKETWMVNLWLTNDQSLYVPARGTAEGSALYAERNLEKFVTDLLLDVLHEGPIAAFITDLLQVVMERVDWAALCESLRAD